LVTHVVTSRSIPPEVDSPSSIESSISRRPTDDSPRTVNPSLLERPNEPHPHLSSKPKSLNDRRPETDARRDQNNDVLHRARQMGMKIWALEKLQRMITTINDGDSIASHGRSNNGGASARTRDTNLSQVLQNERLNGSLNRDPSASIKDILMFKGPFIYVHDIEEKTRPVMVREYSRVTRRQDGAWPQFRSAPLGKCPFLDEQQPSKKALREKDKKPAVQAQPNAENKAKTMHPPELRVEKKVVQGVSEPNECRVEEKGQAPKQVEQPKAVTTRPPSPRKSSESFIVPSLTHTGPFHLGREPAASGVQPSNITSAIRSQMISSTAAAPGTKGSVSREIHELKRKVLEKNNAGISMATGLSSHPRAEASRTLNPVVGTSNRSNKYKMPEKLGQIHEEDTTHSEDNGNKKPSTTNRKVDGHKKNKENRKDPKPGYCENCRDKFDDFDEVRVKPGDVGRFADAVTAYRNKEAS
jgi:regulatory subunit for Cdc7p protein kinase